MKPLVAATFTAVIVGFAVPVLQGAFFDAPASAEVQSMRDIQDVSSIDYPEEEMWRPVLHSTRGGTAALPDLLTPSACSTLIAAADGKGTPFNLTICYHIKTGEIIRADD